MINLVDYVKLTRPANCVMAGTAAVLAAVISAGQLEPTAAVAYAFIAVLLMMGGGNAVNDYYDYELDRVKKSKRPIASGRIHRDDGLRFAMLLLLAGIAVSWLINVHCFVIAAFASVMLIVYNKVKRSLSSSSLVIGGLVALLFVYGGLAVGLSAAAVFVGVIAGLSTVAREVTKDIEDMEEDEGEKKTLPLSLGERKSSLLAAVLLVACIALSLHPVLTLSFNSYYLAAIFVVDSIFLYSGLRLIYNPEKYASDVQRLEKLGMAAALAAFAIGVLPL